MAVVSTDDSHKLPLIAKVSLDGGACLCARDITRAVVIPGCSQTAGSRLLQRPCTPRMTPDNRFIGREREKNELTMHIVKGSVINKVWGGWEEDKQAEHRGFSRAMKLLCDTTMVDTCPLHMRPNL